MFFQLNPEENLSNKGIPEKSSKKRIFIISTVAVAVVLIAAVIYTVFSNYFISPKTQYMKIEQKNLKSDFNNASGDFEKFYNSDVKPFLENNYSKKHTISLDTNFNFIPGLDQQTFHGLESLIGKLQIILYRKINPIKNRSLNDLTISLKGTPLLTGTVSQEKMKLGVKLPDLYKKYMTVDMSDLKPVYRNLNIPNPDKLPEKFKIVGYRDIKNSITLKKDDFAALAEKYGKIYSDSISDGNITIEKNSSFDADGEQIKCDKFILKFDEKWFKDFILKVYDAACQDDLIFDGFYASFVNVMRELRDAGYFTLANITLDDALFQDKDEFRENFKSSKSDFVKELDKLKIKNGVTMTLWTNSSKEILGRKIEIPVDDSTESLFINFQSKIYTRKKDNSKVRSANLQIHPFGNTEEKLYLKLLWENKDDESNANNKFNCAVSSLFGGRNTDLALNIDSSMPKDITLPDAFSQNIKFDYNAVFGKDKYNGTGEADITKTSNDKEKTKSTGYSVKLNINIPDNESPYKFNIDLKNESKMGADFILPEITSSNSTSLNNSSRDELNDAMQEIMGSFQNFMQQNNTLTKFLSPF